MVPRITDEAATSGVDPAAGAGATTSAVALVAKASSVVGAEGATPILARMAGNSARPESTTADTP